MSWRDYSILTRDKQNIIVRVYRPANVSSETPLPAYLYFHGGGHLLGVIETEDAACSRVAAGAGIAVYNVGYRHTPEFTHPTQVNDAWDSFRWLAANAAITGADPARVIVGGISAGAGLAAYIAARYHGALGDRDQDGDENNGGGGLGSLVICGQLLCVPWLAHPDNHPLAGPQHLSYRENVHAPVLPMALLRLFTHILAADDPSDPSLNISAIDGSRLAGLPKASFLVAGQDLLRDEGLFYANKLKNNGYAQLTL